MGLVQALIVRLSTAPAIRHFLLEQAVLVAVVLFHKDVQLGFQVLVHDDLDVRRLIKQYPTSSGTSDQISTAVHEQPEHATTTRTTTVNIQRVQFLRPQLQHLINVLDQKHSSFGGVDCSKALVRPQPSGF